MEEDEDEKFIDEDSIEEYTAKTKRKRKVSQKLITESSEGVDQDHEKHNQSIFALI